MSIAAKILRLSKQLLPTGRAWRAAVDSNEERLFKALAVSETQAYHDAVSIKDSMLPDNSNFTVDDATDWERRLALSSSSLVPLADRKAAILRKMKAPGINPAKGHYLWLQQQLQDAGFNVYVYENIYPTYPSGYTTTNPVIWNGNILSQVQQGDGQEGDFQQGGYLNNIIANDLLNANDIHFDLGTSLRATFYISAGPNTLGTYASVLATRMQEFRQLILSLKQTQAIGVLYVTYV